MLRQSKLYKGFVIEKHCFKISLFPDDTVIYLNGNQLQFKYVFDILETFGSKSGCKVNLDKFSAFFTLAQVEDVKSHPSLRMD